MPPFAGFGYAEMVEAVDVGEVGSQSQVDMMWAMDHETFSRILKNVG